MQCCVEKEWRKEKGAIPVDSLPSCTYWLQHICSSSTLTCSVFLLNVVLRPMRLLLFSWNAGDIPFDNVVRKTSRKRPKPLDRKKMQLMGQIHGSSRNTWQYLIQFDIWPTTLDNICLGVNMVNEGNFSPKYLTKLRIPRARIPAKISVFFPCKVEVRIFVNG